MPPTQNRQTESEIERETHIKSESVREPLNAIQLPTLLPRSISWVGWPRHMKWNRWYFVCIHFGCTLGLHTHTLYDIGRTHKIYCTFNVYTQTTTRPHTPFSVSRTKVINFTPRHCVPLRTYTHTQHNRDIRMYMCMEHIHTHSKCSERCANSHVVRRLCSILLA